MKTRHARTRRDLRYRWCFADPETTTVETGTPDAAAAPEPDKPAEADAGATVETGGEKVAPEQEKLSAFRKGVDEANAADGVPPVVRADPKPGETPAKPEPARGADGKFIDKKLADAEAAKQAEEAKAREGKTPEQLAELDAAKAAQAAIDKEVSDLQLKGKTAERFKELAKRPTAEAVQARIAPLEARAKRLDEFEQVIKDTGASGEQLASTFQYTTAAVNATRGDLKAAEFCLQKCTEEAKIWATMLGREVPGIVDPLAAHPDLAKAVEEGDLTKAHALEMAQLRARGKVTEQVTTRQTKEQQDQAAYAQDKAQAEKDLGEIGKQLRAQDPNFEAKYPYLGPAVAIIEKTLPPNEWANATLEAWKRIPNPPPAAAQPKPQINNPVRPGNTSAQTPLPSNGREAFRLGVRSVMES